MKTIEKIYDEIRQVFGNDFINFAKDDSLAETHQISAFIYFLRGKEQSEKDFYSDLSNNITEYHEDEYDYIPVPHSNDLYKRLETFRDLHNICIVEDATLEIDFDNVRCDLTSYIVFSYDDNLVKISFTIDSYGTTIGGSRYDRSNRPTFDMILVNKVTKTVNLYE